MLHHDYANRHNSRNAIGCLCVQSQFLNWHMRYKISCDHHLLKNFISNNMPQHSKTTRETIIQLYLKGHKPSSIVKLINSNIAISTIHRLIKKFALTKSVKNNSKGAKRKVSKDIISFIDEYYERNR